MIFCKIQIYEEELKLPIFLQIFNSKCPTVHFALLLHTKLDERLKPH